MSRQNQLILHDVPLPVYADSDFITPDFQDAVRFHPKYVEKVDRTKYDPWPIQPYLLWICKQLEKYNARPGRTASDWMVRYFEHFGVTLNP